ncbi:transcription initiation factor TFIID subunit 12 [Zootermopsis nevadensis]|uniref:Transcription initiation factor TFIID subunit 12 n=1 Tax=Zootermopsis nevadensis TaxID=136037 RepID=A0A067RS55_ZOONE|nr:transcription initiation factor TFIID subunit 12 [Zootermopsis nevadensis]XP_021913107.1 transcription initiation factor TFIID subunit 12 [Zootermopsis nevadensis]XP_021913108.1 transcription initiation factor TFIID subunit 12 [Zootermopsis nevadensis]KDR22629.1 Transcription initiation factor TFIID subunit 12 [Zootermopsis nevadensis]
MATNLSGNLGQPQNAVTTIGNIAPAIGVVGTVPSHLSQRPSTPQQHTDTAMEVDSAMQTSLVPSAHVNNSSTPVLGNLQSVVGSGMSNTISTSSVVTMSSHHSPLATALQSGNSGTLSSSNTIGTQVKSLSTTSAASLTAVPHEVQAQILTRSRLQDLVREVDPTEQLDEDVEELLLQLADDFVESTVGAACLLAKHRRASTVEVKDVQLHLERNWNMWIPGFGTDELRPYKRAAVTEAHKQRLALIRKALKKY